MSKDIPPGCLQGTSGAFTPDSGRVPCLTPSTGLAPCCPVSVCLPLPFLTLGSGAEVAPGLVGWLQKLPVWKPKREPVIGRSVWLFGEET